MVDIFKSLDMEYMFSMCASSFMGIHESVLNYAGNKSPESITCTHEEISVAMANGYAKIEGKPRARVRARHGRAAARRDGASTTRGATACRSTSCSATRRTPPIAQGEVFWVHSAQDPCALVRDMTKWDDNPASLAISRSRRCAPTRSR